MISITNDLKNIILDHLHLIENDEFERLYTYIIDSYPLVFVSKLSEVLLSSKINPLQRMQYVPKRFLSLSSEFTFVDIPDHIREIGESAFASTSLERIILPRDLEMLGHLCFARSKIKVLDCFKCKKNLYFGIGTFLSCVDLEYIQLPKNIQITFIERSFQNTPKLKEIIYDDTMENFKINTVFEKGWRYSSHGDIIVSCTDGWFTMGDTI